MPLYDMLLNKNEKILKFVADYKINLISPNALTREDADRLRLGFARGNAVREVFKR